MKNKFALAGLFATGMLLSTACGGADDETSESEELSAYAGESGAEQAELPADFPRDLIPPRFTSSFYTDMKHINGTEGAAFESSEPVQSTIEHYVALLGEPTLSVDSEDGQKNVQWHTTPWAGWIVGVLGSDTETIVSVTKLPEQ